ncbi:MAG: ribonuclease P protein component [Pedosphaera sp.]|nr:ribonuclease P protein component [Pedosphaera sp.]
MPAPVSTRLTLPRGMRMQQTREFTRVKEKGRRAVRGCLIMNWLPLLPTGSSKIGVITSKKIGKANIRSRARRLLREVFRLHQHELSEPVALVLVARNSIVKRKLADVEKDFLTLLRQANLMMNKA